MHLNQLLFLWITEPPDCRRLQPNYLLSYRQIHTKVPSVNLDNYIVKKAELKKRDWNRCDRMKKTFDWSKGARSLQEVKPGKKVFVEDANKKDTVICKRQEPRSHDMKLENYAELHRNRQTLSQLPDWAKSESPVIPRKLQLIPKFRRQYPQLIDRCIQENPYTTVLQNISNPLNYLKKGDVILLYYRIC